MARSRKQRANDRRLGMMARRGSARKTFKRRRSTSRVMARRRRSSRRSSSRRYFSRGGRGRRIGGSIVATAKPMAAGIGGGLIAESIADRVMPSVSPIAGYGGAYLFGGVKGVIGKVIYDVTIGGRSPFGGLGIGSGGGGGL